MDVERWLQRLHEERTPFCIAALAAVVFVFTPHLFTLAVTISFVLLPHLPSRVGEMMVDGLDHKHTAEDVGHSAVPDYRVVADSGDALNLQPCAVTVEKMDNLHVKRFLHQMVGSLWHDFGLCCGQQNGALLR